MVTKLENKSKTKILFALSNITDHGKNAKRQSPFQSHSSTARLVWYFKTSSQDWWGPVYLECLLVVFVFIMSSNPSKFIWIFSLCQGCAWRPPQCQTNRRSFWIFVNHKRYHPLLICPRKHLWNYWSQRTRQVTECPWVSASHTQKWTTVRDTITFSNLLHSPFIILVPNPI